MVDRVVVDPVRRAKIQPAISAAREHYVCPSGEACRLYTRRHVNVVVGRAAGAVHRQEQLPFKSPWIDRVPELEPADTVDLGDPAETRSHVRILGVAAE